MTESVENSQAQPSAEPSTANITTAVVPTQRVFRKAKDVLKALIVTKNPEAGNVDFNDLVATVDPASKQVTLSLVNAPTNNYDVSSVPVLTYTVPALQGFVNEVLGFASQYKVDQKEQVQAALPDGLTMVFGNPDSEGVIIGTITVDPQVRTLHFKDSITPASLFLEQAEGATATIRFTAEANPVIDLSKMITGGDLGLITMADLLESVTPRSA